MTRINHKYTEEEKEFIKNNVKNCYLSDLVIKFNKKFNTNITEQQLENFKQRYKLKSGINYQFTEEQQLFINYNIDKMFTGELAKEFNKKFNTNITQKQIRNYKSRNKLHSRLVYREGKPITAPLLPVGFEYKSNGSVFIKITNKRNVKKQWQTKARYVYEKEYGKIPKGYEIIHLDGDKSNDNLCNLQMVKKGVVQAINLQQLRTNNKQANETAIKLVELQMEKNKKKKQVI